VWTESGVLQLIDVATGERLLSGEEEEEDVGKFKITSISNEKLLKNLRNVLYENDYAKYKELFCDLGSGVSLHVKNNRVRRGLNSVRERNYEEVKDLAVGYSEGKKAFLARRKL